MHKFITQFKHSWLNRAITIIENYTNKLYYIRQKYLLLLCTINFALVSTGVVCNAECTDNTMCWGTSANQCISCRNYLYLPNSTCVSSCENISSLKWVLNTNRRYHIIINIQEREEREKRGKEENEKGNSDLQIIIRQLLSICQCTSCICHYSYRHFYSDSHSRQCQLCHPLCDGKCTGKVS